MYFENVLARINELESKRLAILNNRDWSLEGKNRQKKAWEIEKQAARADAITSLRADISTLRRRFAENETARAKAQEAAARQWDWNRLQYEAMAVKAAIDTLPNINSISGADFVHEFERLYKSVIHSQNTHKQRAYCEVGAAYLLSRFPNDTRAKVLANDLQNDLNSLTTTQELNDVEAAGVQLADIGLKIINAIKVCKRYYSDGGKALFNTPDEFDKMLEGITVTYGEFDGPTGLQKITLSIDTTVNTAMVEKP